MSAYREHVEALELRWRESLAATRLDAVVVAAGQSRPYFLDDQAPPYRANPHFAQWLPGFECPGSQLLLAPDVKPRLYFLRAEDFWHVPAAVPETDGAIEVRTFASEDALTEAIARDFERYNRTALVGETDAGSTNLPVGEINPAQLLARIHFARARKTAFELDCMRRASALAVQGHRAAEAAFAAGASEYEIHQAYLAASAQCESDLPYPNIVALNEHAGVLHYQHHDRSRPPHRSSLLIDAGARFRGYAADVTRTHAGIAGGDFAALIEGLDARQRALIATIRPGLSFVDLHEAMHVSVAELLVDARLVRSSATAAFEQGITDAFFPHGLGHLIGLQTHDVGGHLVSAEGGTRAPPARYPALRLTRTIEIDQVFTIEPGLYFIPLLLRALRESAAGREVDWARVEHVAPCGGIRIEDNVRVGSDGVENLTRDAFDAHSSAEGAA